MTTIQEWMRQHQERWAAFEAAQTKIPHDRAVSPTEAMILSRGDRALGRRVPVVAGDDERERPLEGAVLYHEVHLATGEANVVYHLPASYDDGDYDAGVPERIEHFRVIWPEEQHERNEGERRLDPLTPTPVAFEDDWERPALTLDDLKAREGWT